MVKFVSLTWEKCGTEVVERKVGESAPRDFIKLLDKKPQKMVYLIPTKPRLILTVEDPTGKHYQEDVYGILKYYSNVRVTAKLRDKLKLHLMECSFEIDECHSSISNVYRCIQEFVESLR